MGSVKGPTQFIHDQPADNTPIFGGEFINMRRLAEEGGYDYTYLSKIFSGDRMPGPAFAKRLATDLGLTLPELYACCEDAAERREALKA